MGRGAVKTIITVGNGTRIPEAVETSAYSLYRLKYPGSEENHRK
jgi:hypothetical protein